MQPGRVARWDRTRDCRTTGNEETSCSPHAYLPFGAFPGCPSLQRDLMQIRRFSAAVSRQGKARPDGATSARTTPLLTEMMKWRCRRLPARLGSYVCDKPGTRGRGRAQ
jgi:hypothetical protein